MNRLLLRGGLSRATRPAGSPAFLQTGVVRYQSSEEVAQDRSEDDDVEAGNAATALASDGPPLQQMNGSVPHRGESVAAHRRPVWQVNGALPQNGLHGSNHSRFSRPGQVGGSGRAVSAPPAPLGSLNGVSGAGISPLSRVNGKDSLAVSGEGGNTRMVNGAGAPTLPVTRNVAPQPHQRGQNNNNSSRQSQNPWDSLLKLKDGGVGAHGGAHATNLSRRLEDIAGGGAATRRSDPLRSSLPYSAPNGSSNLKVRKVPCYLGLAIALLLGTKGAFLHPRACSASSAASRWKQQKKKPLHAGL